MTVPALDQPARLLRDLDGQDEPVFSGLPPGNAALPDLLALAGCRRLQVPGAPSGLWSGRAGGSLILNQGSTPLAGELPAATPVPALTAAPSAARAEWLRRIDEASSLARAGAPDAPAAAPLADGWDVFNPLPLARHAVCALTPLAGPCPAAVVDDRGARYPLQRLRPADAAERWLASVPLGALAATRLRPLTLATSGGQWEVTPRVLDQGRVRAEFTLQGRLERLSWDGQFSAFAGQPTLLDQEGRELPVAEVRVAEAGPARAALIHAHGPATLRWELTEHDDALTLAVEALAEPCQLLLPLEGLTPPLVGDALGVRAAAEAGAWQHGIRWVLAGDGLGTSGILSAEGRSLALSSERGSSVRAHGAGVLVALQPGLRLRLTSGARLPAGIGLPLGEHVPWTGPNLGQRFRLVAPPHLAVLWAAHPSAQAGAAEHGQLLVAELAGRRLRGYLYPQRRRHAPPAAAKVDARGMIREALRATAEQDGYQFQLNAHEISLIRWTL